MTRKEILYHLQENLCATCSYASDMESCDIRKCDNKDLIKALSSEQCEDAVSREAALKAFKPYGISQDAWESCDTFKRLNALPSVYPTAKTGRLKIIENNGIYRLICSCCGHEIWHTIPIPKMKLTKEEIWDYFESDRHLNLYCRKCGAKFESEVKE